MVERFAVSELERLFAVRFGLSAEAAAVGGLRDFLASYREPWLLYGAKFIAVAISYRAKRDGFAVGRVGRAATRAG